jgi:branched-chain amino acid transport system substrate-binding protein
MKTVAIDIRRRPACRDSPKGAFAQSGPIKIGVVTPLSGTYADRPAGPLGARTGSQEINAAAASPGAAQAAVRGRGGEPAVAVQKAEKLFQVEKSTS